MALLQMLIILIQQYSIYINYVLPGYIYHRLHVLYTYTKSTSIIILYLEAANSSTNY
jgi:hypothetical protein